VQDVDVLRQRVSADGRLQAFWWILLLYSV